MISTTPSRPAGRLRSDRRRRSGRLPRRLSALLHPGPGRYPDRAGPATRAVVPVSGPRGSDARKERHDQSLRQHRPSLDGISGARRHDHERPGHMNWGAGVGAMMGWIPEPAVLPRAPAQFAGEKPARSTTTCAPPPSASAPTSWEADVRPGEQAWPEEAPFHTPVFVLTHQKREPWVHPGGTTFHFVNDGAERALALEPSGGGRPRRPAHLGRRGRDPAVPEPGCRRRAGDRLAPVLFGGGRRLFENLREPLPHFRIDTVLAGPAATHMRYVRR